MSFLARLLGRTARGDRGTLPFSSDQIALIKADFTPLKKLRPGVEKNVVDYIVRGSSSDVLQTLRQMQPAAHSCMLRKLDESDSSPRHDLFLTLDVWPAAAMRRYGEILAAPHRIRNRRARRYSSEGT